MHPHPLPANDLDLRVRNLDAQLAAALDRISALDQILKTYRPTLLAAFDLAGNPRTWDTLSRQSGQWSPLSLIAWPFKVYNTSQGSTLQAQVNGGDGFVGTINGVVARVNGQPIDTPTGSPPVYPQLSTPGDGVIYGHVSSINPDGLGGFGSLDIYYASSLPAPDTANPATYVNFLLATVSGGIISNAINYGYSAMNICRGIPTIY